jgi:hypothetical protein
MNIRILCLASLFCCSTMICMQKQSPVIPPAKEGLNAAAGFILKKFGLYDINTDETQQVLEAFAELTNDPNNTIHYLMQLKQFQTLASRTAEKDYFIDLQLLDAIKRNNTAEIRDLLERCKGRQSIKDVANKFLAEENEANHVIISNRSQGVANNNNSN